MSFEFSTSIWGINLKRTMCFTYISFCKNAVNKVLRKNKLSAESRLHDVVHPRVPLQK